MSAEFVIPDWMVPADGPPAPPPQPPVNDHRVEALVNRFIAAKQDALFDAHDAYYRSQGGNAVTGVPIILDRLAALRDGTLDQATDAGLRAALGPRLDLHIADAADGIDRHAAAQRDVLNRQIISERQRLIGRAAELEHTNDDKLAGLAEANASAAFELARMNDQPEGPAAEMARSSIWRSAIGRRLANGDGAGALDLFDRFKHQIAPADGRLLDQPLQAAALNRTAEQWIERETAAPGEPLAARLKAAPDLSPVEKALVHLKLGNRDSAQASDRAAAVRGLGDKLAASAQALTTAPGTYRLGELAALANAYEDAGATDSAAAIRPLAAYEPLLLTFARLGADRQGPAIDALPEDARPAARAILREQAAAFAKDAFSAGTALYDEIGASVPADDIAGRIGQARRIAERRGIPVAPFSADEIASIRDTLAGGSAEQRRALLTHLDALPGDMKMALGPLLAPPKPREIDSDIPGDDSAFHRDGVQIAQANAEPTAPSATPGGEHGKAPTFRIGTDFEAFERELEKQREIQKQEDRQAAERTAEASGSSGAPATEPAPGSPEYQAADAEARRIAAEQDQKQRPPEHAAEPPKPDNGQGEPEEPPSPRSPEAPADTAPPLVIEPGTSRETGPRRAGGAIPIPPGTIGPDLAPILDALGKAASSAASAAPRLAGALAAAGFVLLTPGNTQSGTQPIADGLRVRTAPGQRSATVELRVGEGLLGTGIGERWKALPVDAQKVVEPNGRTHIAIDRRGLEAALRAHGAAMAKPPQDSDKSEEEKAESEKQRHSIGGNSSKFTEEELKPDDDEPKPPLNPAPLAVPSFKRDVDQKPRDTAEQEAKRREIRETAEYIAGGHAAREHLDDRREYPGMSRSEFVDLIEHVMTNPTIAKSFPRSGREAYWDEQSKLFVIKNPLQPDKGTAFKRLDGRSYMRNMQDR